MILAIAEEDQFLGIDPISGQYREFPNKRAWINHLNTIEIYDGVHQEEVKIYSNPWYFEVRMQERR